MQPTRPATSAPSYARSHCSSSDWLRCSLLQSATAQAVTPFRITDFGGWAEFGFFMSLEDQGARQFLRFEFQSGRVSAELAHLDMRRATSIIRAFFTFNWWGRIGVQSKES